MSNHQDLRDEYSDNIDDQLLRVAKTEHIDQQPQHHHQQHHQHHHHHHNHNHHHLVIDEGPAHIKLEEIALAAASVKDLQSHPDKYILEDAELDQLQRHEHQLRHPVSQRHAHNQPPAQLLQQQHLQQQLLQQEQHKSSLYQHIQPLPYDDEYNIHIPDPVVDSKLKIYPVEENTITADGNLITRPYPDQLFHLREDLNDFIQEFARDNGFGVVIAHSNKKAIYYTCELGGQYRHKKMASADASSPQSAPEEENAEDDTYILDPNAKTKKLRCPFSMTASYKKSNGIWTLKITCNEHNHPQLDPLSSHPMLRKRLDELNLLILDLYKLGTKPSHIEAKIKELYPGVLIKREDIYNEIRGYKRKLKKQNSRYAFSNATSRYQQYKRRTMATSGLGQGGDDSGQGSVASAAPTPQQFREHLDSQLSAHLSRDLGEDLQMQTSQSRSDDAAAAVVAAQAAAAATNAFLNSNHEDDDDDDEDEEDDQTRLAPGCVSRNTSDDIRNSLGESNSISNSSSSGSNSIRRNLADRDADTIGRNHPSQLHITDDLESITYDLRDDLQVEQQEHDFQQQLREVAEAAHRHLLDSQPSFHHHQFQAHLQNHGLSDDDAAVITAVTQAESAHQSSNSPSPSMGNIDGRLVGE